MLVSELRRLQRELDEAVQRAEALQREKGELEDKVGSVDTCGKCGRRCGCVSVNTFLMCVHTGCPHLQARQSDAHAEASHSALRDDAKLRVSEAERAAAASEQRASASETRARLAGERLEGLTADLAVLRQQQQRHRGLSQGGGGGDPLAAVGGGGGGGVSPLPPRGAGGDDAAAELRSAAGCLGALGDRAAALAARMTRNPGLVGEEQVGKLGGSWVEAGKLGGSL